MNNLLKLRKEKNMTRPELSQKSGVPASTIHKLEIGVNDMKGAKADTIYKLANALNTTVEYLLEYYLKPNIGTVFHDAVLRAVTGLTKEEWKNLKWQDTGLKFGVNENKQYFNTRYDIAIYLGYKPYALIVDENGYNYGDEYCYEKEGNLYIFRDNYTMRIAEIPRSINDVVESYA